MSRVMQEAPANVCIKFLDLPRNKFEDSILLSKGERRKITDTERPINIMYEYKPF